jgi:hypothetical protein
MIRPDPAKTWDVVRRFIGDKPVPACNLFGPANAASEVGSVGTGHTG